MRFFFFFSPFLLRDDVQPFSENGWKWAGRGAKKNMMKRRALKCNEYVFTKNLKKKKKRVKLEIWENLWCIKSPMEYHIKYTRSIIIAHYIIILESLIHPLIILSSLKVWSTFCIHCLKHVYQVQYSGLWLPFKESINIWFVIY